MNTTAYLLLIGNELLNGDIADTNGVHAIARLREHGVDIVGLEVIPDEPARIIEAIRRVRQAVSPTLLITSGGIGPTHDDLTVRSIADALGQPVVRHAEFESTIRNHYGDRATEPVLAMADMPRDVELIFGDSFFPLIRIGDIYALPGDPDFFRRKLAMLLDRLDAASPFHVRRVFVHADESGLATILSDLQAAEPTVPIGSYPRRNESGQWVTLVRFEARSEADVERAAATLLQRLPAGVTAEHG